jgi:AcrR family transcriptional regulator
LVNGVKLFISVKNKYVASKDRILRLKEETRCNILIASLQIVKEEGWQALSMRKIADKIEYTAPIIYEYYANKEAILKELTKKGYYLLCQKISEAKQQHEQPEHQLEAMWIAYWNFAFDETELYQIMYGVEMNCCILQKEFPLADTNRELLSESIGKIMGIDDLDSDIIHTKFYTFWSLVHGLISLVLLGKGQSDEINRQVLKDSISGIIRSLKV